MPSEWFIYALLDANGSVFYVGFTRNHKRRLMEHKRILGRLVTMEILECGTGVDREWSTAEKFWIAEMKSRGFVLINRSNGGCGAATTSDETKRKLSQALKGRAVSLEVREKISKATKGVPKEWTAEGEKRVQSAQFKKKECPEEKILKKNEKLLSCPT